MNNFVSFLLVTLIACGIFLSPSCTEINPPIPKNTTLSPKENSIPETKVETNTLPAFTMTITDGLGRKITLKKLPQRIVSLAPSNTEMLYALGLEDRIVGVTDYCDYPEGAKTKPKVAGYSTPNMEKLVSVEPDLIFAESIHEKTVLPALEKLGLTVIVITAKSIDSVLNNIQLIGNVNGKANTGMQLANKLKTRIDEVKSKTINLTTDKRPRVFYVIWHQPITTMGRNTFSDDVIRTAGGLNIFADDFEKSATVSLEGIVAKNPNIIIISGMATTENQIYNYIKNEERLRSIDAMINNHIYKISNSNLIERAGPRIVDGLEELAKLIHPEIFGKRD